LESSQLKKLTKETRGQEIPQYLCTGTLEGLLKTSLRSACSVDEVLFLVKVNFCSWDYTPQVPDYQGFWITKHQFKGVLLHLHTNKHTRQSLKLKYFNSFITRNPDLTTTLYYSCGNSTPMVNGTEEAISINRHKGGLKSSTML